MKIFVHLLVSTLAIIIATFIIPGATITFWSAFVLAVVLGVINVFIKPVVKILTLPLTILTLGLFSLIINTLFIILASKIVPGFHISGFWTAFWFSIALSLINAFFDLFQDRD